MKGTFGNLGVYPAVPQTVDRPEIFETIEYIFLAFYVCEMLTRVVVLRKSWFYTAEDDTGKGGGR